MNRKLGLYRGAAVALTCILTAASATGCVIRPSSSTPEAPETVVTVTETASTSSPTSSKQQENDFTSAPSVKDSLPSESSLQSDNATSSDNAKAEPSKELLGKPRSTVKIGGIKPSTADKENIFIDATAAQKEQGGFDTARLTIRWEGSNSLLTYPLVNGEANANVAWNFSQDGEVLTCEDTFEVFDADGNPTDYASAGILTQREPCKIPMGSGYNAAATFTAPGEYIIAVTAQQPGFAPVTIAQKVKVVG